MFAQFDTDKDGRLSTKELTRALKSLPKSKPKHIPPGTKFMSVDDMIAALDVDGDGSIDETEWLDNLAKCAGLAAALAENVNEAGEVASFRSFEEQKAKREAQVAALREKWKAGEVDDKTYIWMNHEMFVDEGGNPTTDWQPLGGFVDGFGFPPKSRAV